MHSHLFFMLLSPRAPFSHFTPSLTCAICLPLPTFSHILYTFIFSYLYISSVPTFSLLCVNHFRQNNIFFSPFHCFCLRLGAPKSLRTGLLWCGVVAQPAWQLHNRIVMCWVADFLEQRVWNPVNCRHHTPVYASLWRLELLSSPPQQTDSTEQLRCDRLLFCSILNHLCFTDGWIELVMFLCTPYELCYPLRLFFKVFSRGRLGRLGLLWARKSPYCQRHCVSAWPVSLCLVCVRGGRFLCCILGEAGSPLWMGARSQSHRAVCCWRMHRLGLCVVKEQHGCDLGAQQGSTPLDLFCQ